MYERTAPLAIWEASLEMIVGDIYTIRCVYPTNDFNTHRCYSSTSSKYSRYFFFKSIFYKCLKLYTLSISFPIKFVLFKFDDFFLLQQYVYKYMHHCYDFTIFIHSYHDNQPEEMFQGHMESVFFERYLFTIHLWKLEKFWNIR